MNRSLRILFYFHTKLFVGIYSWEIELARTTLIYLFNLYRVYFIGVIDTTSSGTFISVIFFFYAFLNFRPLSPDLDHTNTHTIGIYPWENLMVKKYKKNYLQTVYTIKIHDINSRKLFSIFFKWFLLVFIII